MSLSWDRSRYEPKSVTQTDLHKIVKNNFIDAIRDSNYPFHIQREFRKYLKCGILDYGFARFQCSFCKNEKLVPFSCKGRTICPSCNGRRMADTARHLVDEVIPDVPISNGCYHFLLKNVFY